MIKQMKIQISNEELCKDLPEQFLTYVNYCKNLKFEEKPNYGYARSIFANCLSSREETADVYFDWLIRKLGRKIPDKAYFDFNL